MKFERPGHAPHGGKIKKGFDAITMAKIVGGIHNGKAFECKSTSTSVEVNSLLPEIRTLRHYILFPKYNDGFGEINDLLNYYKKGKNFTLEAQEEGKKYKGNKNPYSLLDMDFYHRRFDVEFFIYSDGSFSLAIRPKRKHAQIYEVNRDNLHKISKQEYDILRYCITKIRLEMAKEKFQESHPQDNS